MFQGDFLFPKNYPLKDTSSRYIDVGELSEYQGSQFNVRFYRECDSILFGRIEKLSEEDRSFRNMLSQFVSSNYELNLQRVVAQGFTKEQAIESAGFLLRTPSDIPLSIDCDLVEDYEKLIQSANKLTQIEQKTAANSFMIGLLGNLVPKVIECCSKMNCDEIDFIELMNAIQHVSPDIRKNLKSKILKLNNEGKIWDQEYAFFLDRFEIDQNRLQIFGTQFTYNSEGQKVLLPIDNLQSVD